MGRLGNRWFISRRLPSTQGSGGSSHSVHTWCGPMTITRLHIYLPRVNSKGLQWCKTQQLSPRGEYGIQQWHLKVESRHQNRHQTYNIQNCGRLNSEKENYLLRTHGIIGISLIKRHWRWRLLLWHRGKANNTSRTSLCQGWQQNHIMLTQCCRKSHQIEAMVTDGHYGH